MDSSGVGMIVAVVILVTMSAFFSATTLRTVLFTRLFHESGPTISTVVLTPVVLIFGEISPKSLAREHAESFAMFAAPLLRFFLALLRPLNFLFSQWKRLLNRVFRPSGDPGITEEELISMVSEAENEGGLDQHESRLIRSAIEFGDVEAGDILIPRVDIVGVEVNTAMEEIVGEIWDEHDEVVEPFRPQVDGSYLISAGAGPAGLYDLFSLPGRCGAGSVSGWVIEELGHLPRVGDRFQSEGLDVTITQVGHHRVLEIRVIPQQQKEVR